MALKLAVADAHVDVLWRMEAEGLSFYDDLTLLQAGYQKLQSGGVTTQVFALFTMPTASAGAQLESILRQIDVFGQRVIRRHSVAGVRTRKDYQAAQTAGEIVAILSLEGGGCLHGRTAPLRVLNQLGVQGLGLTWNSANELADGCMEPRGAGLTESGRKVLSELNRMHMWVDIAHLSDAGVRDVFRWSEGPVMASHANSRAVHPHPRNLSDAVIQELIRRDGWIGLTFEASFVGHVGSTSRTDLFRHIDHLLDLGAENVLGFGSDFDGTFTAVQGLADAADYESLAEMLVESYGRGVAEKLLHRNFESFLNSALP